MTVFPDGLLPVYLTSLSESGNNDLRAVVSVAVAGDQEIPIPDLNILGKALLPTGDQYEFYWETYVAYSVRNESFAQLDSDRPPSNSQFTERTSSAYLDFVRRTTFEDYCRAVFKAPIRHWELICLDHFLDVVSATPPAIRKL